MISDVLIFLAGGFFGALVTFFLLRALQSEPSNITGANRETVVPTESPAEGESSNPAGGEPGRMGDLHAQHLEAAARIRDQRAASRAAREAQRIAAEEEAHRDAQRLAAEEEVRLEVQRIAAEAQAARDAQRVASEEAARREAQRIAAEELEYLEAQRIAAQAQAAREAQRVATVDEARREVQRIAAEEKTRQEAQRVAAEELAAREAEQEAAQEKARLDPQRIATEQQARLEAQRIADEEEAARKAPVVAKPAAPKPLSETIIMIVDDSKVGRIKTNRFLVNNQFQSQMAEDGCDAIEKINVRMPDVVITDVEMPNMDGFELTKHIRSNPLTAHIPVIIISGNNDGYEVKAKEVGADLILGKPYSETQMIDQIHEFLRNGRQASVA